MIALVMTGGLDTMASMTGFVMRFLAMNPPHRQRLLDEPAIVPAAVDELIRRHGVTSTARPITRDLELHGIMLREGDQIVGLTLRRRSTTGSTAGRHGAFG